jgi:RecG-like helicase
VKGERPRKAAAGAGMDEKGGQPLPAAMSTPPDSGNYDRPPPSRQVSPIGSLTSPGRAVAEGRVHTVEIRPVEHNTVLACDVEDSTGQLTALFYGRSNIPGLRPGVKVRLRGQVGIREGRPVMINPAYQLLAPGADDDAEPDDAEPR